MGYQGGGFHQVTGFGIGIGFWGWSCDLGPEDDVVGVELAAGGLTRVGGGVDDWPGIVGDSAWPLAKAKSGLGPEVAIVAEARDCGGSNVGVVGVVEAVAGTAVEVGVEVNDGVAAGNGIGAGVVVAGLVTIGANGGACGELGVEAEATVGTAV